MTQPPSDSVPVDLASTASSATTATDSHAALSEYEFDFDLTTGSAEIRKVFFDFCERVAHVGEACRLLDALSTGRWPQLLSQNSELSKWHEELVATAAEIVDRFVRPGATDECNLPAAVSRAAVAAVETLRSAAAPATAAEAEATRAACSQIFRQAYSVVQISLKLDVFPRFVRSDHLRRYLTPMLSSSDAKTKKHGLFLLQQCAVLKSARDAERYVYYNVDEIRQPVVSPKDVKMARGLLQDSKDWKLVWMSPDGSAQAYQSSKQFITEEAVHGNWSLFKLCYYVPYDVNLLVTAANDTSAHRLLANAKDFRQAAYIPPVDPAAVDARATSTCYMIVAPPVPILQPRYMRSATSMWMEHDADSGRVRYVGLVRPSSSSIIPETIPGCVSGRVFSGLCYEQVSDELTRFTQILYGNFGGFMSSDFASSMAQRNLRKFMSKRIQAQQAAAHRAVAAYRKCRTFPECDDAVGFLATLRDYCERANVPEEQLPPFFKPSKEGKPFLLANRQHAPFLHNEVERFRKGGVPVLKKKQAAAADAEKKAHE